MKTSIFDLFKIGIGPSSSHTVGPMRAAHRFAAGLTEAGKLAETTRVLAELYGSLALTGIGHGTDRAVLLGLAGEKPEQVDPEQIGVIVQAIRRDRKLRLNGEKEIQFAVETDLLFHTDQRLPGHPNGMKFTALDHAGNVLASEIFYSIGGGFILKEGETDGSGNQPLPVPHPFSNGAELLEEAESKRLPDRKSVV